MKKQSEFSQVAEMIELMEHRKQQNERFIKTVSELNSQLKPLNVEVWWNGFSEGYRYYSFTLDFPAKRETLRLVADSIMSEKDLIDKLCTLIKNRLFFD